MKILYFANMRMPTERAHGIQAVEMCNAFSEAGCTVTFITPIRGARKDVFEYYGIKTDAFTWVRIPNIIILLYTKFGFWLQTLSFMISATIYVLLHRDYDVIYIKDDKIAYLMSFFSRRIFWEPHVGYSSFLTRRMMKAAAGIVALTDGVQQDLIANNTDPRKIMVAHDAVRLEMFTNTLSRDDARKCCNIPVDEMVVMYVGHLFDWKGVNTLAEAMRFVPEYTSYFVGGLEADVESFRSKYQADQNVRVLGNKPREDIPLYLRAADILVLPNTKKEIISSKYTSPLKLFEYMASQRPIVASRLPSLQEVLNDRNAFFFDADDSQDLARVLQTVDLQSKLTRSRVDCAFGQVSQNTWLNRAKKIRYFINEQLATKNQ